MRPIIAGLAAGLLTGSKKTTQQGGRRVAQQVVRRPVKVVSSMPARGFSPESIPPKVCSGSPKAKPPAGEKGFFHNGKWVWY